MPDKEQCVRVNVTGSGAQGDISLSTRGTLQSFDDGWMLRYEETDPDARFSSETILQCQGDRVIMTRSGSILSTIIFVEREAFTGDYQTPYGSFQIRVYPSTVRVRRRGNIGDVHLEYQMSLYSARTPLEESDTRFLTVRFSPCKS